MNKKYENLEIELIYLQEEIVRTSEIFEGDYSGDSQDDWGGDIWE